MSRLMYGILYENYSMTLNEAYAEGLELWDFDTKITPLLDAEIKELFNLKYGPREIGIVTWEKFKNNVQVIIAENYRKWNRLYSLYESALAKDPLINQRFTTIASVEGLIKSTLQAKVINKDNETPESSVSSIDDGYLTSLAESDNTSDSEQENTNSSNSLYEGFSEQEINLLDNFKNKFYDVVKEAVDEFKMLFLLVY